MDFKYDFNIGMKISLYQGKVGGGTIPLWWMFTVVVFSLGARDLHQWWYGTALPLIILVNATDPKTEHPLTKLLFLRTLAFSVTTMRIQQSTSIERHKKRSVVFFF